MIQNTLEAYKTCFKQILNLPIISPPLQLQPLGMLGVCNGNDSSNIYFIYSKNYQFYTKLAIFLSFQSFTQFDKVTIYLNHPKNYRFDKKFWYFFFISSFISSFYQLKNPTPWSARGVLTLQYFCPCTT